MPRCVTAPRRLQRSRAALARRAATAFSWNSRSQMLPFALCLLEEPLRLPGRRCGASCWWMLLTRTRSGVGAGGLGQGLAPAVVGVVADLAPVDGDQDHRLVRRRAGRSRGRRAGRRSLRPAAMPPPMSGWPSGGVTSAENVASRTGPSSGTCAAAAPRGARPHASEASACRRVSPTVIRTRLVFAGPIRPRREGRVSACMCPTMLRCRTAATVRSDDFGPMLPHNLGAASFPVAQWDFENRLIGADVTDASGTKRRRLPVRRRRHPRLLNRGRRGDALPARHGAAVCPGAARSTRPAG